MAVVRWSPLSELATLQSDMARMMDSFWGTGARGPGNGGTGSTWFPAVDVTETDDALVLAFDLPGLNEDEINIELNDNVLTVSGRREREHERKEDNFYRWERRFGEFSRSVALPAGVTENDVNASYENGVLEVRVPKPEEQRPKRIQIGVGNRAIEGKSTRKS
jgi:HSP20 family protein